MRHFLFVFIVQILVLFHCKAQSQADRVIERYRKYLWMTETQSPGRVVVLTAAVKNLEGKMSGQDHGKALVLLHDIRDLAIAWSDPSSNFHRQDTIQTILNASLQRCLVYLQQNPAWALYEMDVAGDVRDITVLLDQDLIPDHKTQCFSILKQHRLQGKGSGTGMTLTNELGMHYSALINDTLQTARCRDLIVNDINGFEGSGIQTDGSFHHGGKRLDMFQSGRAFLLDHIRIAWQLQGTSWAYPNEKANLLVHAIIEGWQWMARGIHTVPGVLGDFAATENALRSADIRAFIPFLKDLAPERSKELLDFEQWQNGREVSPGVHYWPMSDLTAYHEKDYSFFMKTVSGRTLPALVSDDVNRKGHLQYTGDTYFVHDGMEYFNLMPVWDWQRLPGVTSFDKARIVERQPLAGNVNNGKSSATAMDLMLRDSLQQQHLSARKFWAVHDGVMICLVGGMQGRFAGHAITTLDQCRWRGDVTVNKVGNVLKPGVHKLNNVSWVHHAGFVYMTFPFYTHRVSTFAGLESRSGNWRSINRKQPGKPVTDHVFQLSIDHGHLLHSDVEANGYIVARAATPQAAQAIAAKPEWGVFGNRDVQMVHFNDNTIMAAFYKPFNMGTSKADIEVSAPCLVLIENNRVYVGSIDGKGKSIRVKWNNIVFKVTPPADGRTVIAQEVEEK